MSYEYPAGGIDGSEYIYRICDEGYDDRSGKSLSRLCRQGRASQYGNGIYADIAKVNPGNIEYNRSNAGSDGLSIEVNIYIERSVHLFK